MCVFCFLMIRLPPRSPLFPSTTFFRSVLVNGDEEISSPGSRALLARLGAEHDATMSFEASRAESDKLALATAGRSEEHTSELSHANISYAVFCLKKKKQRKTTIR